MDKKTVHGRKEIRTSSKQIRRTIWFRFILVILVIFGSGALTGRLTAPKPKTEDTNEQIMQRVNTYGSFDNQVMTKEVDLDWKADDPDFVPLDVSMDEDTQKFIYYLSDSYNIDFTLVMAIIEQESDFDSKCVSSTSDYGLMQINQCNHEWLTDTLGVTDYLDSKQNARAGIFVLRKLFEEYSDTNMVLMAYNMGETGASRLWAEGIYSSSYSQEVREKQKVFE